MTTEITYFFSGFFNNKNNSNHKESKKERKNREVLLTGRKQNLLDGKKNNQNNEWNDFKNTLSESGSRFFKIVIILNFCKIQSISVTSRMLAFGMFLKVWTGGRPFKNFFTNEGLILFFYFIFLFNSPKNRKCRREMKKENLFRSKKKNSSLTSSFRVSAVGILLLFVSLMHAWERRVG